MFRKSSKPVRIPITDEIDLHTFQPKEIPSVVKEYITECIRLRIFRIRIIHGKGRSVQKKIVQSILENHTMVVEYYDAAPESGGWGATIAHLKHTP